MGRRAPASPPPAVALVGLAASVGTPGATALYAAFVRDLDARLATVPWPVWWAYTPATAPFRRVVGTRRAFPQRGRDLGARIDHAVRTVAHRTGGAAVIALGADAPHVSRREIVRAAAALARGADVVLGPSEDGGYWLIGLRAPCPELFGRIAWSTAGVADATRRRCARLGLRCVEVASQFDVDDAEDLVRLARIVRRRPQELAHTRRVLARINRRAGSPRPAVSPSSGCGRR